MDSPLPYDGQRADLVTERDRTPRNVTCSPLKNRGSGFSPSSTGEKNQGMGLRLGLEVFFLAWLNSVE